MTIFQEKPASAVGVLIISFHTKNETIRLGACIAMPKNEYGHKLQEIDDSHHDVQRGIWRERQTENKLKNLEHVSVGFVAQ